MLGTAAAFAAVLLLIAYAIALTLGLLSLASPQDPIGDPYFSIMELLIVVLSLAGLLGVPLADANVRNIGIVGCVGVALVVFLLLGIVFGRTRRLPEGSGVWVSGGPNTSSQGPCG